MNFLAHCYLSCSDEELLIGNFITDFLKPGEWENYKGRVEQGIELHRQIDVFTDQHVNSKALRRILRKRHGKYAPVVVDLIWDYYLSKTWLEFSDESLSSFTTTTYSILDKNKSLFPSALNINFDSMVRNDFLNAYNGLDRAKKSLGWMDRRARFSSNFEDAIYDIEENDEEFQNLFLSFFNDIRQHIQSSCLF